MAGGCQTSESQPREAPQEGRQDQPQQEERQWGHGEARDWVTGFRFACCKHGFLQAWTVIERRCRHAATTQDRPANQDEEGDGQNGNSVRTTPGQGDIPQNQSQNEAWQEPTQYYEPAQPPQGQSQKGGNQGGRGKGKGKQQGLGPHNFDPAPQNRPQPRVTATLMISARL